MGYSRQSAISHSLTLLFLTIIAVAAQAQTGVLSGRVIDSATGRAMAGATIRVLGNDATTRQSGAISASNGSYLVKALAPGRYRVLVTFVSYAPFQKSNVEIKAGETTTVDAVLSERGLGLEEIVVSASRRPEKITDAPASVTVVDARKIEERPALTPIDHLRSVQGIDIVQSGLTQNNVVTRGFNNAFSGQLMVLTDNRIASVPSLRVNVYNFIPLVNDDIQQIEIIRGPGSALYGPNNSNGVLHIITRSPFSSAGTSISISGGERNVFQGMFRHAGTIGDKLGYKISGQYMTGEDWGYVDTAETAARKDFIDTHPGINPDTLKIAMRDSTIKRVAGEVRLDYMPTEDLTLIGAVGMNTAINNTDITGVGAAQAQDWRYTYFQMRALYKDLFLQTFLNQSDAGDTYLLRTGAPIVDRSTLFVAQAQHSYQFADIERLTYGADFQFTNPVTDSTITGRNEGDDDIKQIGIYLQSETKLIADMLDLTVAGRFDKHSRLDDPVVSPRAALVFRPLKDQTFRFTYNRAYSEPTSNDLFLDIVAGKTPLFDVRATGIPNSGFSFRFDQNGDPFMHSFLYPKPDSAISINDVHLVWPGVKEVLKSNITDPDIQALIDQIPAPAAGVVDSELRILNTTTGAFDSFNKSQIIGRTPTKPTINQTLELGYKGILLDRIALSVDLYRSQYNDFVGPLQVITPTVFLEQTSLAGYLTQVFRGAGMDSVTAAGQGGLYASIVSGAAGIKAASGVPLGTISANEATDPTAVVLASRNYGQVTLYGYDIGLQAAITEGLTFNGSLSYVDKNFLHNLDGVADLALNAPKFKFSVGLEYRSTEYGFTVESRLRHVDGFRVNSGAYVGAVPGYSVVDLNVDYPLPWVDGLRATLTVQNLLTFVEGSSESPFSLRHSEFVGTPALGRLILGRLSYTFR